MKGIPTFLKYITLLAVITVLCSCSKKQQPAEQPIKVKTVTAAGGEAGSLYYSGSVEAEQSINLSFLTIGTAAQINVREGDKVTKGQLLAKLDCTSNNNALQIAQAKAQQAQDAFNRFEPMYKNGNLPEIKMVEIRTLKTQAELAVKLAQKSVGDCSVIAPAAGMISYRDLEAGDNVIPGKAVLKMVTLGSVYATFSAPEKEIGKIYKGQSAAVKITSQESEELKGTVTDVGVSADPLARTYTVRVKINKPSSSVLPGMLCNIYLASKDAQGADFIIPASALKMDSDGGEYVFVVDAQTKRVFKQAVTTGEFVSGGVRTQGLKEGQVIVTEGAQKLEENTLVEAEI